MIYDKVSDENLATRAHEGCEEAEEELIIRYKNLVLAKSRRYFLIGGDGEDVVQEGMIGLYKAIRDYTPDKNVSFYRFAEVCVTRRIINAIKLANRMKHQPLNTYISLSRPPADDEDGLEVVELLSAGAAHSPEEIYLDHERVAEIEQVIADNLSVFERDVIALYLNGVTYRQIASIMNKEEKSIDNALQRIKRKIKSNL